MAPIRTDLLSNERMLMDDGIEERPFKGEKTRRNYLDHKTFENEIQDFLQDRLDNAHLSAFLQHFDTCQVCRDELYIQYLVKAGLPKLETGETFNLQKEVDSYISQERLHLFRRTRLRVYAFTLEIITLAAFGGAVAATLMYYFR